MFPMCSPVESTSLSVRLHKFINHLLWIVVTRLSLTLAACAGGGVGNSSGSTTPPPPSNPVPAVTGVSPTPLTAGNSGTTVTVMGTGFISSSTVRWNQTNRQTTFVSATQLQATVAVNNPGSADSGTQTAVVHSTKAALQKHKRIAGCTSGSCRFRR